MKAIRRFVLMAAVASSMLPISLRAAEIWPSGGPTSYILLQHGGIADRPLALVITADKAIAEFFRVKSVEDIASSEKVFTRVHVLTKEEFNEVAAFVARESTKLTQPEWGLKPSPDVGIFGASSRTKDHKVASFFFVLSPRDSLAFFERLSDFLGERNISTELQREANSLTEWMSRVIQASK